MNVLRMKNWANMLSSAFPQVTFTASAVTFSQACEVFWVY